MEGLGQDGGDLGALLSRPFPPLPETSAVVANIMARRRAFGITRLGSVTGLDRTGIPVAQVTRPASRTVCVNQGKGLSYGQAAISALMESLESWASERIAEERVHEADFDTVDADGLWSHLLPEGADTVGPLTWIKGWDFLSGRSRMVPLALVDTNYVIPSPHPQWLPRNSTGLAAGTSLQRAMLHACLEILERHACHHAMRRPHFFDRFQIGTGTIRSGEAGEIINRLNRQGFVAGVWSVPSSLPVYWCQVMEAAGQVRLAPLPASGFGCDISHDRALAKALLEACQSRSGVISGAREDVTGHFYQHPDISEISAWRLFLSQQGAPFPVSEAPPSGENDLKLALDALVAAGARAVIAVVLHQDEAIPLHVVRIVAPPLETNTDG